MSNTLGPLPSLGGNLPTLGGQTSAGASSGQPQVQSVQVQMSQDAGLGQAMLSVLDQIVARLLGQQPVDSQGNPTGTSVYLQYQTGQGVDPRQYENPWTPMGGSSLQSVLQSGAVSQTPAATTDASSATGSGSGQGSSQTPQVDTALEASLMSAWETSNLVDSMFLVDTKGQLQTYQGGGRSLAFAYGEIIQGMQPANPAQPSAQVQAEVQAAQDILWQTDQNGNVTGPTQLYQNYLTNQMAWAQAKSNLAAAQAEAMTNPALGQVWPQMATTYQTAVDQAYDTWIGEGAEKVEQALSTIAAEGQDVVDAMVANAKELFQAWSLAGLAGVPTQTQYSMVSPITWYDPTDNSTGFETLTVTSQSAAADAQQNRNSFSNSWYQGQSSNTTASASGSFFGISLGASGGSSQASSTSNAGGQSATTSQTGDQTSEVSITLEWLLCQVQRPWLVSDLFYVNGWYMVNQRKDSISDGTVQGQIDNEAQLLPMIPTAFLVVRNVTISAGNWGQTADALQAASTQSQSSGQASSSNFGGNVGFFGMGASAAHSSTQDAGQSSSSSSGQVSWSWSGDSEQGTLTISGAQILGWVGSIVPASPPVDDPNLAAQTGSSSGSSSPSSGGSSSPSSGSSSSPSSGGSSSSSPSNSPSSSATGSQSGPAGTPPSQPTVGSPGTAGPPPVASPAAAPSQSPAGPPSGGSTGS